MRDRHDGSSGGKKISHYANYLYATTCACQLTEQFSVQSLRSENEDEFNFWLQEAWYSNFRPRPQPHVICNWIVKNDQFRVPLQFYDISQEMKWNEILTTEIMPYMDDDNHLFQATSFPGLFSTERKKRIALGKEVATSGKK